MSVFTEKNIKDLDETCEQIRTTLGLHCGGSLMATQQLLLGKLVKQFVNNPIVATSGIVQPASN